MKIYLGSDHRGFELKEQVKEWLLGQGYEVEDVGAHMFDPGDDYVDCAVKVAEMIEGSSSIEGFEERGKEINERGILLCGSGHGVDIVANRFPHVRAILAFNEQVTVQGREHEDANVLVIPAEWVSIKEAEERVRLFLETEKIENTRYDRRRFRITNLRIRAS